MLTDFLGHQDEIDLEVDQEDVTDLGHVIADHQEEDQDPAVDQEIVEDDPEAAKKDEDLEVDHDLRKDPEVDRLQSAVKKKKVEADPGDEATDPDQTGTILIKNMSHFYLCTNGQGSKSC